MIREVFYTGKFRKDFKLAIKRGLDMELIRKVMKDLENGISLDPKYKEHPLSGDYAGNLECHIQPDWLMVYMLDETSVTFVRTGSHSDLF